MNDCSPHFSEMSYTTLVAENSEVGDVITILTATDEDEGNNGQVFTIIMRDKGVYCLASVFIKYGWLQYVRKVKARIQNVYAILKVNRMRWIVVVCRL